jgi:5-methylthioadenosine/S-adenosylhomocysteine deaminase
MDPIRRNILATGAAATAMAAASRVFAQQAGQGGAATLVIRGGIVHSVDNPRGEARDIVVKGDTIADIVAPGSVTNVDAEFLDAARRLVVPGLINAHTHSHGGLSKGVGDLWSLELLLNAAPWIGGSRRAEDKYLAALINAIEHVEKGSTACYDLFFEFPTPTLEGIEAVASAYEKVGLRAVIAPMVADLTFYQSVPGLIEALPEDARPHASELRMSSADASLAALRMIAKRWSYPADRLRLGIAPTIPQHCTREFMIGCRDIAREHNVAMQSHVSEPRYLSASSFRFAGMSMTETMDACGIVGPWFSAAHAVWINDKDMVLLAGKGAQVAHNPGSNLRLGSGVAAVREYVRHGIPVGIGTDGSASSDNQNMFEAMRLAAFVSRIRGQPPQEWISTGEAFGMATEGSARVLGMQDFIGRIAKGYKADLVLIDLDSVNYVPLNNATNQLVFTEDGTAVDKVLIGGRLVVSGGRAIGIDRAALARQAGEAVERLSALNADARRFAESIEPMISNFCRGLADDEAMHRLHRDIPAR